MSDRKILVSLLIGIPIVILWGCLGCGETAPTKAVQPVVPRPARQRIIKGQIKQATHEMLPPLDVDEVPAWVGVRVTVTGRLHLATPYEKIPGKWCCLFIPKDERCGYTCRIREGRARGLTKNAIYSVSGNFELAHQVEGEPPLWIMTLDDCDLNWESWNW